MPFYDTFVPLCKVYREVYVKMEFIGSLTISCDRLLVNHSAVAFHVAFSHRINVRPRLQVQWDAGRACLF